jgi:hypothetical protein
VIYALVDPDTLEIRYIGKTSASLPTRLQRHRADAKMGVDTPVYRWWRKYGEPCIIPLEPGDSLQERQWIAWLKSQSARLLNCTAGGDGCLATKEIRCKIAASQRARWSNPENKAKWSVGRKGRKLPAETRARMSKASKGRKKTQIHKARISSALRGKIPSLETRARMSVSARIRCAREHESRS